MGRIVDSSGRTIVNDGMMSMMTKLGQKSDARKHAPARTLTPNLLWNLYRSSWIVKKFIDKTAQDMTKNWREIQSNDFDADTLAIYTEQERKLKIKESAEAALTWSSLFGDTIVLAITDVMDARYQTPLDLDTEEIKRFLVIDRRGYTLGDIEDNILEDNYGNPKDYTIKGDLKVHHSRVHRIMAGMQPFSEAARSRYGVSDVNALYEAIRQFDSISTSIDDLIEDSNVDVLFIEGLNDQIAAGNEDAVIAYLGVAKQGKSHSNILAVDKKDGYEQKQAAFGGLADLWVKAGNVLAGALDRPITILFGQSASGFNSGEEDNKNYYDTISALQESRLRPLLDFFDKFIFDKMGKKPLDWWYEFPTIDAMNKKDQASIFAAYCTGLVALVQAGIITEAQALKELKQKAVFENITDADINEAEQLIREAGDGFGTDFGAQASAGATESLIASHQAQQAIRGLVP